MPCILSAQDQIMSKLENLINKSEYLFNQAEVSHDYGMIMFHKGQAEAYWHIYYLLTNPSP